MPLLPEDGERVAAAMRAAETMTDGEVMVILARRSDAYRDVATLWAMLAMLLLLAIVSAVPGHLAGPFDRLAGAWDKGLSTGALLAILLAGQALAFLLAWGVLAYPPFRLALTPRGVRGRRVRARAVEHFRAAIEARTATHSGALLYLSLAERRAEIVTDSAIAAKVPPEAWGETMAALVAAMRGGRPADGIVAAVARMGQIMAGPLPFTGTDPNELPERLILL